jgi:hypothetical protein
MSAMLIRPALPADAGDIWRVLEPVIVSGETYALPRDMTHEDALAYWSSPGHEVFVADIVGRQPKAFRHPSVGLVDALDASILVSSRRSAPREPPAQTGSS